MGVGVLTKGRQVDADVDGEEVVHFPLGLVLGGEGRRCYLHFVWWTHRRVVVWSVGHVLEFDFF